MDFANDVSSLMARLEKQIHAASEDGRGYVASMVIKSAEPVNKSGSAGLVIKGYASTADLDRIQDSVNPQAFSKYLKGYMETNPIVLLQHNHDAPIGRAEKAEIDSNGLYVEDLIFNKTEAQQEATTLIDQGVLRTLSIGGIVLKSKWFNIPGADPESWRSEGREIEEMELLEHSVVSVPMNARAGFYQAGMKNASAGAILARANKAMATKNHDMLAQVLGDLEKALGEMQAAHGSVKGLLDAAAGAKEETHASFTPDVLEQLRRIDSRLQ